MKHTAKRVMSILLAVLMCLSMLTGIILPASATTPATTDAYAKINATNGVPADNVYFVNTAWSTAPAAVGETFSYTYGNGSTWGNGETYTLTWGTNAMSSYAEAVAKMVALSTEWAADTENKSNEAVFVFAPGKVTDSTGAATLKAAAEDPTVAQLFNVVLLGPQAGVIPVSGDYSSAANTSKLCNNRGVSASTEFIFANTFYMPDHANTYMDGFGFTASARVYGGNDYTSFTGDNLVLQDVTEPYNNSVITIGGISLNTKVHFYNSFLNYNGELANTNNQVMVSNDIKFDNCVFLNGKLSTNHSNNQTHHIKYYPVNKAEASANFYGTQAATPSFVMSNCGIANWESCHFLRLDANDTKDTYLLTYSTYTDNAVTVNVENNSFYDMGKFIGGRSDVFYLDAVSEAQTGYYTLNVIGNRFIFSKAFFDKKTDNQGLVFNGCGASYINVFNIRENVFQGPQDTIRYIPFYSIAPMIDVSGNLFLDPDNNVVPMRNSSVGNGYTANWNVQSDIYAGESMVGGVKELMSVREINGGALCYSFIQTRNQHNANNNISYMLGVITVLLKRNDDGTAIEYDADTLIRFNSDEVVYEGIYTDKTCKTKVETVTQDNITGKYAKATYVDGNTKLTVVYYLNTPTTYRIVDPEGDYTTSGYKFNGVTYYPGQTASDGVTATASTRADGTTGFYQYIENTHKDSNGDVISSAYNGIANPNTDDQYGNMANNAMTTIIVLSPGSYNTYTGAQGMGKSVSIVGPQFGVSPYDEDLAAEGKFAGDRAFDPTKEAVLTLGFSAAHDGAYNYSFDGIAFIGAAGVNVVAASNLISSRFANVVVRNCIFNGNQMITCSKSDKSTSFPLISLTVKDCAYDGSQMNRTGEAKPLIDVRANFIDIENVLVANDTNLGTSDHMRFVYAALSNGALLKMKTKTHLSVTNSTFYNTKRNAALYSLRDSVTLNANFDYYPEGVVFNAINNRFIKHQAGYAFGVQCGEATGDYKFVKLTATDNYVDGPALQGYYFIQNYNTTAGRADSAYSDDTVIKDNVIIAGQNVSTGFVTYAGKVNVDDNFYGTYDGNNNVIPYPIAEGEDATGIEKDRTSYYLDPEMTTKNTDLGIVDAGFDTYKLADWKGVNEYTIGTDEQITTDDLKAPAGATIEGIYSDAACTQSVANVGHSQTLYIKVTKGEFTMINKVALTCACDHKGFVENAGTLNDSTCSSTGTQEYICDNCGAVSRTEVVAKKPHTPVETVIPYPGQEPTCIAMGKGYKACEKCTEEAESNIDIPMIPHTKGSELVQGETTHWYPCTTPNCTYKYDETGHVPAEDLVVTNEPTCSETGTGDSVCKDCGKTVETDVVIPATGKHDDTRWETVIEPNYVREGLRVEYCNDCDQETGNTEILPKQEGEEILETFEDIKASDWYVKNGAVDFAYNMDLITGVTDTTFEAKTAMTRGMFVTILGRLHGVEAEVTVTKFTDVQKNKYYAGYVKWASENGIVKGITDYAFAPNASITREQLCVMLVRYSNYAGIELTAAEEAIAFTDAAQISKFAKSAVTICQKADVINGEKVEGGYRFRPAGQATRAEVATIIMNYYMNCVL